MSEITRCPTDVEPVASLSGQALALTPRHNYARLGMHNAISVLVGRTCTSRFATVDHSCGHALAKETMHREDHVAVDCD